MTVRETAVTVAWTVTSAVSITGAALGAWSWWWVLLGAGWLPIPVIGLFAWLGFEFARAWGGR